MSNETFNLSILLTYKDNASKGIATTVSQLQAFRKEAKSFISIYERLQKTVSKEISPKIKLPKIDNPDNFVPKKAKDELDKITGKTEKQYNLVNKLANLNEKVFEPSRQIADTWKRELESLEKYTDESKKLYLAQSKFKLINLSPEENKKAFDAVTESVRKIGITTRAEGIETLTDLHTAFGNLEHAIETLPLASKYRFSMETFFGDKFSSSQIEEQIQNAAKFLEVTGKVAKGREEMERSFNVMTQITNATGGRVTSSEMLLMGRRAGASGRNLTPQGLTNLSAVIQEMGGDRTGTSLMSLYQALVGGVMKQSAAAEFARLGLIDKSKIEYGKAQKIKKILPGANKLGDLMMEDPLSAADMLREAMKKNGIKTDDPKEISKELAILFGNRNAQNLMDILINQRSQVVKESDLSKNAQNINQMFEGMDNNLKNLQMFEKAWADFKAEIGKPLIEIGSGLAKSLLPIMKFFGDHPTLTQWTMAALLVGKALKGIAETASILKTSGLTSFFSQTTNQVGAMNTELITTTNKVGGLKGAVQKFSSSPIGITVSVLAITGLVELIRSELQIAAEAGKSQKDLSELTKTNYKTFQNTEKDGTTFVQKDIEGQASTSWYTALNSGLGIATKGKEWDKMPALLKFSDAAKQSYLYPISKYYGAENKFTGYGYTKDKNTFATGFKTFNSELADSRIMAAFLRQLDTRIPNKDDQTLVKQGLQTAFPESFAAAMKELSGISFTPLTQGMTEFSNQVNTQKQNFDLLNPPMVTFGQNLTDTNTPITNTKDLIFSLGEASNKTTTPLNNITTSANRAIRGLDLVGYQFANFKLQTPTFQPIQIPYSTGNTTGKTSTGKTPSLLDLGAGNATGGFVNNKGLAYIHANEEIIPANVSRIYNGGIRGFVEELASLRNFDDSNQQNISPVQDIVNMVFSMRNKPLEQDINIGNVAQVYKEREITKENNSNQPITINYSPIVNLPEKSHISKTDIKSALRESISELDRIIAKAIKRGRERA